MTNEGEYLIEFNTKIDPGKIQAVRIRIDLVTLRDDDMEKEFRIDLCNHPLYPELKRYVESNE